MGEGNEVGGLQQVAKGIGQVSARKQGGDLRQKVSVFVGVLKDQTAPDRKSVV